MLLNLLFGNSMPFYTKLIIFFTFLVAVVFALTAHEFSHAFVAYKLGDRTPKQAGRLSFNPMVHFDALGLMMFVLVGFGYAKPVPINPYNFRNIKRDTFLVSIAGVVVNFLLAFLFYPLVLLMLKFYSDSIIWQIFFYLFTYIFQVNLVFMVFNILPIYPLDGFNAIASQLRYDNKFVQFMHRYGHLILLSVIILFSTTGVYNFLVNIIGYPITAFWGLFF